MSGGYQKFATAQFYGKSTIASTRVDIHLFK